MVNETNIYHLGIHGHRAHISRRPVGFVALLRWLLRRGRLSSTVVAAVRIVRRVKIRESRLPRDWKGRTAELLVSSVGVLSKMINVWFGRY